MFDDLTKSTYRPKKAIVVYERHSKYDSQLNYHHRFQSYVTVHDIVDDVIAAGKPITRTSLLKICALVMPQLKQPPAYLPPDVLAYSPTDELILWWTPAGTRKVLFRNDKVESGKAPLPPLVFAAERHTLRVWALAENARPTPKTVLYNPPFFNTTAHGTCMGDVSLPHKASPDTYKDWEDRFFRSYFTHEGVNTIKGIGLTTLWQRLTAGKYKTFPTNCLTKWGTLENYLSQKGSR